MVLISFQTTFGQLNMHVEVPRGPIDELTHLPLIEQEVLEGMKTEMSQLETLKVGVCLPEDEGRELAKKANVKILSSRCSVDSEEGRFGEMSTRCERVCVGCRQSV